MKTLTAGSTHYKEPYRLDWFKVISWAALMFISWGAVCGIAFAILSALQFVYTLLAG